jgi:glycosyltransferase involved in cell wall biosynthesis
LRPQKFAKYLPLFGWKPIVLTVNPRYYQILDSERLEDVACEVYRTGMIPHPAQCNLNIKKLVAFLTSRNGQQRSINDTTDGKRINFGSGDFYLKRFLRSALFLPDPLAGWIIPAVIKGLALVKKYDITSIFTTSPPHSVQIIGLILKKLTGCRWLADFRDPWGYLLGGGDPLCRKIELAVEKSVVKNADVVIPVTIESGDYFIERYGEMAKSKLKIIENGVDIDDFAKTRVRSNQTRNKFTISYIGRLYNGRSPEVFLKAVRSLLDEGQLIRDELTLQFIGDLQNAKDVSFQDMVKKTGLSSVTKISGHVTYNKAIEYMVTSDVLILLSERSCYHPTKAYEYLASGTHVIAFTPPGSLAEIIDDYPKGFWVNLEDFMGAKEAILSCYHRVTQQRSTPFVYEQKPNILGRFERKRLTEILAQVM